MTGMRNARRRAFAALATVLLCLSGVVALAAPANAQPRLLLLPIVVHSAEDPDYLRAGLSDMLASRFERIGALDLVRGEADGTGTTDLDEARQLAKKRGADYVLYGSFTRFGQGASLDVHCAPVAGDESTGAPAPLREIFVHSGSIGEIIPDLDELAGKVSRYARGEAIATGVPASPGGVPTAGPGAAELQDLRNRVEGLEAAVRALLEESANSGSAP
jgi:outer membrane protein insertion porin family